MNKAFAQRWHITRRRAALFLMIMVAVGLAWRYAGALFFVCPARILVERHIKLGRIDLNDLTNVTFVVENSGDRPLTIHEAKTNCNCQGVYTDSADGIKRAVRDLQVPARQSRTLGLQFVAGGKVSEPSFISLDLCTNDPEDSVVRITIEYTPTQKIYFVPQSAVFGTVAPGEIVIRKIAVFADNRAQKILAGSITTDRNELFDVVFIPKVGVPDTNRLGNSLAVEIGEMDLRLFAPSEPRTISLELALSQNRQHIATLPIAASVVPDHQLLPSVVSFPRRSSAGNLYECTVLCRSRDGKPFQLRLGSKPAGFAVDGLTTVKASTHLFTVSYTGDRSSDVSESVELVVGTMVLRLSVRVQPDSTGVAKSNGDKE